MTRLVIVCGLCIVTCLPTVLAEPRNYTQARGDITVDYAYGCLARLTQTGQMEEAEKRANEVLAKFGGTQYECLVHDKLAAGYERQRKIPQAIAKWQLSMASSDPTKGSWTGARKKILQDGGTPPSAPPAAVPPPAVDRSPRKPLPAPARSVQSFAPASAPIASAAQNRPATPRTTDSALSRDPAFESAMADLRAGDYQGLRAAVKKLESLLLDHGYQGSASESELQGRIAEAYLKLSAQHYRWADASGSTNRSGPASAARSRAEELDQLASRPVTATR